MLYEKIIGFKNETQTRLYKKFFPAIYLPCKSCVCGNPIDGIDYDCGYEKSGYISCDNCVCNNGEWNPENGKKISRLERILMRRRRAAYWKEKRKNEAHNYQNSSVLKSGTDTNDSQNDRKRNL